jgi:tRNA(fMet)-specific endonuclease VapC
LIVRTFLQQFPSPPSEDEAADHQAIIRSTLGQTDTPIRPHDLMIASIAQRNGLTLATRNIREFERIPSLKLEEW